MHQRLMHGVFDLQGQESERKVACESSLSRSIIDVP